MTKSEIRHTRKQDLVAQLHGVQQQLYIEQAITAIQSAMIRDLKADVARSCPTEMLRAHGLATLMMVASWPIVKLSPAVLKRLDRAVVAAGGASILPKVEK